MPTHVREFIKPEPITLRIKQQRVDEKTKKVEIVDTEAPYDFEMYVGEFVWAYSKWNTEDGWDEAQIRIGEAIEAAAPGELVKIEELSDWEKLHEANKAADIKGPHAARVRKLQRVIKSATAPKPAAVQEAPAPAGS